MISWRLWQRKFAGDPARIGGTIVVNDVPLTIVGILPQGFSGLTGKGELWIPPPMAARLTYSEYLTTPQNFISVVARLKDGVTFAQANAELAAIGSRFIGNGSSPGTRVGRDGCPASRRAGRARAAAIRPHIACGGRMRAGHRLRQRGQPAPRARARAATRRSRSGWPSVRAGAAWCSSCSPRGW